MFYFNRCIRCNSIWVCWNWICLTSPESLDPRPAEWSHECWNCAACWTTRGRQKGIPYWLLSRIGKYFVDDRLFEKNLAEDMAKIQRDFGVDEEEW